MGTYPLRGDTHVQGYVEAASEMVPMGTMEGVLDLGITSAVLETCVGRTELLQRAPPEVAAVAVGSVHHRGDEDAAGV